MLKDVVHLDDAPASPNRKPLRVLAFLEARVLTGPAKNVIGFASRARNAAPQPIEIVLATFDRGAAGPNLFIQAAQDANIATEVIPERGALDPGVIPRIRELVERVRPDVIQTHAVKSHFLMLLAGAWRTTPWIAFHHGYTTTDWKTELYNRLDRISLRYPRHIVTVCQPFRDELRGQGVPEHRVSIIHNSVKPFEAMASSVVDAVRAEFGLSAEVPVLLSIGRLSREKGHADLLQAAAAVRASRPGLRFQVLIAGEGHERPVLERMIRDLELADVVVLCGHQSDVKRLYAVASIVVLPSHSEGSPNVLLEAHAAGIPVVATNVGGVPEIATDGVTALLVPKGDTAAMAEAIGRLLEDSELARRIAEAGKDDVQRRFTPAIHLQSMLRLYGSVRDSVNPLT